MRDFAKLVEYFASAEKAYRAYLGFKASLAESTTLFEEADSLPEAQKLRDRVKIYMMVLSGADPCEVVFADATG